jgi:hypothetical protein
MESPRISMRWAACSGRQGIRGARLVLASAHSDSERDQRSQSAATASETSGESTQIGATSIGYFPGNPVFQSLSGTVQIPYCRRSARSFINGRKHVSEE